MANWEAARRKTDLFGCNHRNRMAREIGSELRYFSLSDCLIQLFCSWRLDRNLFTMRTHELSLTLKYVQERLPYANLHCLEN